ncbi:MAG: EamA family transporter, partial [Synergistaceae bacterium]|nr:EamA family transporter [Synergistaceae bacterium]
FASMDGLKAHTIAIFGYLDPVTALILAALILGESLSIYGIIGVILILGAALVCELE